MKHRTSFYSITHLIACVELFSLWWSSSVGEVVMLRSLFNWNVCFLAFYFNGWLVTKIRIRNLNDKLWILQKVPDCWWAFLALLVGWLFPLLGMSHWLPLRLNLCWVGLWWILSRSHSYVSYSVRRLPDGGRFVRKKCSAMDIGWLCCYGASFYLPRWKKVVFIVVLPFLWLTWSEEKSPRRLIWVWCWQRHFKRLDIQYGHHTDDASVVVALCAELHGPKSVRFYWGWLIRQTLEVLQHR